MVNSGSSANLLALSSFNFKKGSEIITPSLTFSTTVSPIYQLGYVAHFIGVEENKFLSDINQIKKCINKKTVAIMLPNLLGNVLEWKTIYNIAKKYNNLPIVIDHIAKPKILNQEIDEWKADMKKLSMLDNIFCKYSGIVTEIGEDYNLEQIKPYTDFIFEIFDTNKIMWGSDWPVLTMAEKYENWFDIAHTLIPNLSNDEKMNVFSHTARNFYKI